MSTGRRLGERRQLLRDLASAGRAHSDATVFFHETLASRVNLNATDWKAMSVLQRRGPLTAGEIARETGLTTASVTALIDRLERRRLVRRRPDASDRRRVIVEATTEAVQAFMTLLESSKRSLSKLWHHYTTDELAVIADFLNRNAERLRAETTVLAHAAPPVAPRAAADRR